MGFYEDPHRIYETLKHGGNEESQNHAGTSFNILSHPHDNVTTQTLDEQEYTYAQVSDLDKRYSNSDPENHAMYHILEQPEEQERGDNFHSCPNNTILTNPDFIYAKDIEIPRRSSKDQKSGLRGKYISSAPSGF